MKIIFKEGDRKFYRSECPSEAGLWQVAAAPGYTAYQGPEESVIRYISSLPADAKYSVKEVK